MSKVNNPVPEKYSEFLKLIETLCQCYDETGEDVLALSISTAIRVLVYDTGNSTSLLTHAGKKNTSFLSTNLKNKSESIHLGLVRKINVGVNDGIGGEAKYWALCDERYFPKPAETKMLSFDNWWNKEKIFKNNNASLSRKDLVLAIANKDGGAHYDNKVQKKYDDFRYSYSGGSTLVGISSGIKRGYDNIPVRPAIRQIGYEVLCTLKT